MRRENSIEITVGDGDIDNYNHVGYDSHLRWFKQGHRRLLDSVGIGFERLESEYGLRTVVRRAEVDYVSQLHKGDVVRVSTKVESIGRSSLTYLNEVDSGGKPSVHAKITVVFVGQEGRPSQIPEDVRRILHTVIAYSVKQEKYDDFGAPIH